jgi:hypothetical protein
MSARKDTKQAETEAYTARVKAALEEAHEAAEAAVAEFMTTAEFNAQGLVLDSCGGASVIVRKPSYRLRTALKALGEITPGDTVGAWSISRFGKHVKQQQSITAEERACEAARKVLERHFPGEGKFYAKSHLD